MVCSHDLQGWGRGSLGQHLSPSRADCLTACVLVTAARREWLERGLQRLAGFHSALLCADPASGRLVMQDIWHDPATLAASAAAAAAARAAVARSTPCVIRAVQEHVQVFSSVRMPRS